MLFNPNNIPRIRTTIEIQQEQMGAGTACSNYFIPVWSSVKMLQDVISMECTLQHIIITFTVNIIAAIICVLVIGRLFNTEKIIND